MRAPVSTLVTLIAALTLSLGCVSPAAATAPPKGSRVDVSDVYPSVINSVALIDVTTRDVERQSGQMMSFQGVGSGVLIDKEGRVVTAAHVVQAADKIRVYFTGTEAIEAKVVATDVQADVALLKLAWLPPDAKPAKMANSDKQKVGDRVFVVGAPLGISHTLTVGHLSARRAPDALMTGLSNAELFQTDAAINQGNSGGPMFNMRGEVVGIVSHMITVSGGFDGLGFAVTSNAAKELLLERDGFWGGLSSYLLKDELADIFNIPQAQGLLVQVVAKGSPSEALGLRGGSIPATVGNVELVVGGDIVLEVQGIPMSAKGLEEMRAALGKLEDGGTLTVKILRDGEVMELKTAYSRGG